MTSIITFEPPLGAVEHIRGGSPSQLLQGPQSLYTDFLFKAQLSAHDYETLVVRDGACLQIWTDIPRLEDEDGNEHVWREVEFEDPEALNKEMSSSRKVSLQLSNDQDQTPQPEKPPPHAHTLYVVVPIPSAWAHEFSFTYRIVYPSGRTTWLGFYDRNGAIVVHPDQDFTGTFSSRTIDYTENMSFKGNWSPASFQHGAGFVSSVMDADSLPIATVSDMATTRIWALGKDRLLRHASILILVPAPNVQPSQQKLTHSLSYIISASPGNTLSVSSNGIISASGSGTVQMAIINCLRHYDPVTIVEEALKHSELTTNWALLGDDSRSRTVILACIGNGLPMPAVVVSFGPMQANLTHNPTISVSVQTSRFATLFNNPSSTANRVEEFALFSSSKSAMYVFNVKEEMARPGLVVLEVDSTHPRFTEANTFSIAPLYRLHTQSRLGNSSKILGRHWFAAILTSYRLVQPNSGEPDTKSRVTVSANEGTTTDPRGLLTPPPSPPLRSSLEAENSLSTPSRFSETSSQLSDIAEVSDSVIPVNYAIRKRSVVKGAKIKVATSAPRTELRHLDVNAASGPSFQKAPSRGHLAVDKPPASPSKRPGPKSQRSSCLMWIFRIVFKCLFASVRLFLRVAFNVRIALAWGVGLVIRGPGFAWGLLWGAGVRPGRLSLLDSIGSINQLARESPHHQRKLSSSDMPTSRNLAPPCHDDKREQTGAASVSRSSHLHISSVGDPVMDTTLSSVISHSTPPLYLQSEQEAHEGRHEGNDGFYAEVTPLYSDGVGTVEVVLLTLASAGARSSEKDFRLACTAADVHSSGLDATLLQKSINFLPGRHPPAESVRPCAVLEKAAHTAVDIRPVGVHGTHLASSPGSQPPDVSTTAYTSIRDRPDAISDQKSQVPHQEVLNAQYASSGFRICYQLSRETLDQEAGTVVIAVRPPEPASLQT